MDETDGAWQRLHSAFGSELEDRVRTLSDLLLRLEREQEDEGARRDALDSLLREAHSLKGAARAIESNEIERLAHELETVIEGARGSDVRPAQSWFDLAYRTMDALTPVYARTLQQPDPVAITPARLNSVDTGPSIEKGPRLTPPDDAAVVPQEKPRSNPSETVRVSVDKLDALLVQAGELTVAGMRVDQRVGELNGMRDLLDAWRRDLGRRRGLWSALRRPTTPDGQSVEDRRSVEALLSFTDDSEQHLRDLLQQVDSACALLRGDSAELRLVSRAMQEQVHAARLLPVSTIFAPFGRMVRDLAREHGKHVQLIERGGDVEVDRRVLEQLRDPLMHMVRNAIDHGIEAPEERERRGKPQTGAVTLSAAQKSGTVEIELVDDGRGIDLQRLREAAVRAGLLTFEESRALDDAATTELLYQPGISTTNTVTSTSGRGVGMDVVRENVTRLGGTVATASVSGEGTRFLITVPLSLSTTRALLVHEGDRLFAIPSAMVERAARVRIKEILHIEGRPTVAEDGHPLPAVELHAILEQPRVDGDGEWRCYLIVRQDGRRVAILTGELAGEQGIVVKRLGWPLRRVRNVAGAAVLGSGAIAVVLNPADLVSSALRLSSSAAAAAPATGGRPEKTQQRRRSRVLVVDDSLTTRTLERSILEAAGYEALTAGDGLEALTVLRAEAVDLVISDVDMPRLDGFGLTAEIRRTEALRQMPVILLTSMDAAEHRARGMEAGADAYLVKSGFEQTQLLDTVGRLL